MAHKIELNQLGLGGGLALVFGLGAAIFLGTQTKISRGFMTDTILVVAGGTYSSHIQCDDSEKVSPSFLKSFVGLHAGERVLIKGYSRSDAKAALQENFPDCNIGILSRSSRPLWQKFI